ncbi:HTTM domain-containing protein [Celeribacter persicus]|uniref:Vitamin K-dependent gamma-carboxylase-like protein n=1 Tax=Celeribacter persicus TaxID=1651082 RepID=A0A2T5HSN6_9RHOB|nr:HTTM domain-containing protein [Celeribacter persicus]PTQ74599.1 vitamin K-dependent gamma-carboxylase-like protein [Celeribacter persicus]
MTTTDGTLTDRPDIAARLRPLRDALSRPVSPLSLAIFRIALGALLLWDCWRFIKYDRIYRYWVEPEFHFTYTGFGWVTPLPEPWIYLAWLTVGLSALFVALGLFYRVSIVILTVTFGYFFLLDKAEYLNHFYLVILFLILMCFLPAHRSLSLDAKLFPRVRATHIPYASVAILRAQMEIMLVFAGLVKLTPDWLAGEPLGLWLRAQSEDFLFGFLFQYDWVILAGTWSTVALHIFGAPLLLWKRTRLAIFLVYCLFHSANSVFFNIGIFPWLTIAATTIFFAPDWPLRFGRWLHSCFEDLPEPKTDPAPTRAKPVAGIALLAAAVWVVVQVALPLRAGTIPTEVRWSGDGHRFSWRMRIFDRNADGVFLVTAGDQSWTIEPTDYLTPRQTGKMLVRSDMIHQFASHLERIWQDAGYGNVEVRAEILKSLNGRPPQRYVDPAMDLTAVTLSHTGPDGWVLPLEEPVWGVVHNADR